MTAAQQLVAQGKLSEQLAKAIRKAAQKENRK
jgi:hypothetical protein